MRCTFSASLLLPSNYIFGPCINSIYFKVKKIYWLSSQWNSKFFEIEFVIEGTRVKIYKLLIPVL